ncbi:MAG: efflux RND transporter periplasmic adaptor subunit [Desulfobulbaceae bacterium]|nr:MAG: efflux RND transporter periplasmic adaptor subunit [Desulfobulbaceae bacterium]
MPPTKAKPLWIALLLALIVLFVLFKQRDQDSHAPLHGSGDRAIPVEVAAIRRGPLFLQRTFSGTIEPRTQFIVAPKVGGRIERLYVDVADQVKRGQLVAQLEDSEFRQDVAEAMARLAVARANQVEAESRLEIAKRELNRTSTLNQRGIASESTLDAARSEFLASQAAVQVAAAILNQEQAGLAASEIRLGYTRIKADWQQGDDQRTVAERHVDEGNTVAANTPLLTIVELDPLIAVIQVTEKDYPRLAVGQQVNLTTDAFAEQLFTGTVSRIAPIFRKSSRQARVEIDVPNPGHLLKPGMFTRCTLTLDHFVDAISVPAMAITRRNDRTGVFLVSEEGTSVIWQEVQPGIQDGKQIQLLDTDLHDGLVVTLGQQLLDDGDTIRITTRRPDSATETMKP